ncbi:MAG TPA: SpvB/TcaC N-terminal domain-containing protein [Acidimicrobiales bacterium]|nr:SpvB/TcaC N-terminal domain-containing protein [Acidimicrobiales bacterium]
MPGITLPKGGGAVRGIDEKLTVGLATGAANLTVPFPASPGRQGSGPKLTLSYDSGAGNGVFGLGWRLTVASITRKTSLGLPLYQDADDSDVFILSDAEDLVPLLVPEGDNWSPAVSQDATGTYTVRQYRPRAEAAFARIERWQDNATGDVHWRTVSGDNVTSLYGQDATSRVADPSDPSRIFTWLIDFSYDDRGNAISFQYKAEDSVNVPSVAHEQGRAVGANRYLKRVYYGNTTPYIPAASAAQPTAWFFEVVVDYGDHDEQKPLPAESVPWPCRPDPFSAYRPGFEVRTYRLGRRLLMFHRFPDGLDASAVVVRSLDLSYSAGSYSADGPGDPAIPVVSLLTSVVQTGYIGNATAGYATEQLPPLQLGYSQISVNDAMAVASPAVLANLPTGASGTGWRWCDLDGEGLVGVLAEDDGAWYYKRNVSAYEPDGSSLSAQFEPIELVATKPQGTISGVSPQLVDLHGDGHLCAVDFSPPLPGYFARDDSGGWLPFKAFPATAALDWASPDVRLMDLNGDGLADVLLTEDDAFTWFPWLAEDGFGPAQRRATTRDENAGPALVLDEGDWSVYLADMSGDGLTDLVRVRNGEICYWPNLGFGRFGPKVVMDGAPWFDVPDVFDARRAHLADIDGSGCADLAYVGTDGVTIWFNQSGNSFTAPTVLGTFPAVEDMSTVTTLDLLGTGTTCLVWSSPLPGDNGRQLRYMDVMGGVKPHLLTSLVNNMGGETTLTYATSTRYYVEDLLAGQPWLTRLAFPVHVVAQRRVADVVTGAQLTASYSYHHGYFDDVEREFRGFARVEQTDTDLVPSASGTGTFTGTPPVASTLTGTGTGSGDEFTLPPVLTRTWVNTGAYIHGVEIAAELAKEFFSGDPDAAGLAGTDFVGAATTGYGTPEEMREACRALRGRTIRTEVYALDGQANSANPYTVSQSRYSVQLLQPPSGPSYGSVFASELESLAYHYERGPADPRVSHNLVLETDPYGTVTKSAGVAYPRRSPGYPQQGTALVTYTEHDVVNVDNEVNWYRIGLPVETRSYELMGVTPAAAGGLFQVATLAAEAPTMAEIPSASTGTGATPQKRLTGRARTVYRANDLSGPLPAGQVESLALVDRNYQLSLTPDIITDVYSAVSTAAAVTALATGAGGFVDLDSDGNLWAPSARAFYSPEPASPDATYAGRHFYLPQGHVDPFGGTTTLTWEYDIALVGTTDALENTISAQVNYRVLQPWLVTDANQNRTGGRFDALGQVTATAVMGKETTGGGDEGDHLDLTTDEASATDDPTTTFDYDLTAYGTWAGNPARDVQHPAPVWAHTRARVFHKETTTPWVETYLYTDGLGRTAMAKAQAEAGPAPTRGTDGGLVYDAEGHLEFASTGTRWVGSGKTIYDNKGNPVKSYEPFFDSSPAYDDEADLVQWGVTAITRYDPLGRVIRVDNPDGTYRTVEFDPWQVTTFDEVDSVLTSTWYSTRQSGTLGALERAASSKAAASANTPAVQDHDPLGRAFRKTANNGTGGLYTTTLTLDINGRVRATTDALGRSVLTQDYTLPGTEIHHNSADSGQRWLLPAADGRPLTSWDGRGVRTDWQYDALRRPAAVLVTGAPAGQRVTTRTTYGETLANAAALNLRGSPYQSFDDAGVATIGQRDLDGNTTSARRQLLAVANTAVDWSASPALSSEVFTTTTSYDALHRPTTVTTPDTSVTTPTYNERSLLAAVNVHLRGATTATAFVTAASYDAKGQRQTVSYGNGAISAYTYDPQTFRLVELVTTRPSGPSPVQDLSYTYDSVGNVTHIADAAQQTTFFSNQVVTPDGDYVYDAVYRLVQATGRELVSSAAQPQPTWDDSSRVCVPLPTDTQAVQNYTETYAYDAVGNFQSVTHTAARGSWARTFNYDEPVTPVTNNRLTSTMVGTSRESYSYDANGNITSMPQLPTMAWDWKNMLQVTTSQAATSASPPTTNYTYDQSGRRVQKVNKLANGSLFSDRVYIGPYEVYREYSSTGSVALERQSLHVGAGDYGVCLVETTTVDVSAPPSPITPAARYQLTNFIGSAVLELDPKAAVISYEEYFPYGSTSFQGGRSAAEVSLKRYRYTGKERDTETGFYYHTARYYAPWLGRWTSCDPAGPVDGTNLYAYVRGNPVAANDPTGCQGQAGQGPVVPLTPNSPSLPVKQPSADVGPFRVSDPPQLPLPAGDHEVQEVGVAIPPLHITGGTGVIQARASAAHSDGTPSALSLSGQATFKQFPFDFRLHLQARGTTAAPFSAGTLGQFSGQATVTGDVRVPGLKIGGFELDVTSAGGAGRLSLKGWAGIGGLHLGTFRGTGKFDASGYDLSGTVRVISPVGIGGGRFSLGSATGLRSDLNWFGLQTGPIGLAPSIDPLDSLRPGNMTLSPDDTPNLLQLNAPSSPPTGPGFAVPMFEPGLSAGYTHISTHDLYYRALSIGIAPSPSIQTYAPQFAPLPFPLSSVPSSDTILYGQSLSTSESSLSQFPSHFRPYVGLSYSGNF